jgi:AcrR family transcriptional regulator
MRRVAAELGVTAMAVYHHVERKERRLDLMADSALQAITPAEAVGAWDEALRRFFTALHRLLVAHPAMARVMSERRLEGPTATRQGDQILQLLIAAWFDERPAVRRHVRRRRTDRPPASGRTRRGGWRAAVP